MNKSFLSKIGEFGFIDLINAKFKSLNNKNFIGIGDDCAVFPYSKTSSYVITTDLLVEDVHFLLNKISPYQLGYKSLAVNVSDCIAMGAKPLFSLMSIAIPENIDTFFLNNFFNGYHYLSNNLNISLLGGDTTASFNKIFINIVVVGMAQNRYLHYRNMAKEGDYLCVVGNLGDSGGGLKLILNNSNCNDYNETKLVEHHYLPQILLKEVLWLSKQNGVNAMMDISDGLLSDLPHITTKSEVGAVVNLNSLPLSNELRQVAFKNNWDLIELAAASGEDYKVLLTINRDDFYKINEKFKNKFNFNIEIIGEIVDKSSGLVWELDGKSVKLDDKKFKHF